MQEEVQPDAIHLPAEARPDYFVVSGSHGHLLAEKRAGTVLHRYNLEHMCIDTNKNAEYAEITHFDVGEYAAYNGDIDDTDILLIGYWVEGGKYEPPVYAEREDLRRSVHCSKETP